MKSGALQLVMIFCLVMVVQPGTASEEDELLAAINSFNSAFKQANVLKLDSMLTEYYVHTNSGGKAFGKTAWLNWVASRTARVKEGKLYYREYKTQDLAVVFHQNVAIVTGRNIATGKDDSKDFIVDIRFTHVWIKTSGTWKRAAFHDAKTKG